MNTTATTGGDPTITIADLDRLLEEMRLLEWDDPLAMWMRKQGKDPNLGWIVVLPTGLYNVLLMPPKYVMKGPTLLQPVFVNTRNLDGLIWPPGTGPYVLDLKTTEKP